MPNTALKHLHENLRDLFQRQSHAMVRRPAYGQSSGHAQVRLRGGTVCEVEHAARTIEVDLPTDEGGTATAPHPGELMRASLGACLALGYRLWGARLGVAIAAVDLAITCVYDARGQMGIADDVAIGWQSLNVDVTIASDAPAADVRRVAETAERLSPMLANISPAVKRSFRLTVVPARNP